MKVNLFYRKSFPYGNFSIEKVFDTILPLFTSDNMYIVNKIILPKYSVGLINRAINILFTLLKQTDINHITGDVHYVTLFLKKKNTILTIHDFVILKRNSGIKKILYYYFWYYIPISKSQYVTVISNTIMKELVDFFPFAKNKTFVVYNPLTIQYDLIEKKIKILLL